MSTSAERMFDDAALGWQITSTEGRQEVLKKVISSIGAAGSHGLDTADTVALSQIDDLFELPSYFQGYLFVAYTPDGWDFKAITEFVAR